MQILTQQSEGKGVQASDPPQHPVLDSVSFRKESATSAAFSEPRV